MVRDSDLPTCNYSREVRDFSREVILFTHSEIEKEGYL